MNRIGIFVDGCLVGNPCWINTQRRVLGAAFGALVGWLLVDSRQH